MKTFYQIIAAIFILSLLFIIRDDLKSYYEKDFLLIKSSVETVINTKDRLLSDLTNNNIDVSKNNGSQENIKPISSINISGPLMAINNFIGINETQLSKENIIILTNKERMNNGALPELKENSKLSFSAEKKLQDMFVKQYFEHVSPSGVGVGDLANQVSYEYITIGENLALGNFKDDKALVDAWMASAGHRANILNKKYTEIGVAVGKGKYEGKEVWIAVQHFGLPRSACPSIDEVLHGVINIDQDNIKSMGDELSILRSRIESGAVFEGKTTSEQIDNYNYEIFDYNKLISDIKQKITQYNNQVQAFNLCISNNSSEEL